MPRKEKVSIGIENLDSLTNGGFLKNSTNLIVGESGSGKSILAIQFLLAGIKKGEKVFYVTFEESKEDVYTNMNECGIDLGKLEESGYFYFLEYTPEKIRTMLEEGGGSIENIIRAKGINRLVIDSLTSFELLFEKDVEKRKAILSLFTYLKKWHITSILTYESVPDPASISKVIEFESDSIILLYFNRAQDNQRYRSLEIFKMRGSKHSLKIHPYSITDRGIVV